jgi:gliding motility-associated-like protein
MKLLLQYLLVTLLFFFTRVSFAQGTTCIDASPFCAGGTSLVFPNTSGGGNAEFGPDYGCLGSEPNPAWYYIQIDQSGDLDFNIIQNTQDDFTGTGLDVDFITYGPFNSTNVCDASNLSAANTIACSYSGAFIENFTIPNAMAGEIYVLLITNFSNSPGFIQLEQVNAGEGTAGSTDCSIVNTFNYCDGEVVSLDATTETAASYSWTQNGAVLTETGPILNNVVAPDATYIVEALDGGGAVISTLEFVIDFHDVPTTNTIPDQVACDDNNDGFRLFNFVNYNAIALGTQSSTDYSVTYHPDQVSAENDTNALTSPYTNQSAYVAEPIFVRIENNNNRSCYSTGVFNIRVALNPTAMPVPNYEACDDDYDGFLIFDLSQQTPIILGGLDPSDYTVRYFETETDAINNSDSIFNLNYNAENGQNIYIRLENNTTNCFSVSSFTTTVQRKPEVEIAEQVICLDNLPLTVSAETNVITDSYLWSTGQTTSSIEIGTIGNYSVTVTSAFGCTTTSNFNAIESEAAVIEFTETVNFANPNTLTITVSGIGNYLYQFDDGEPQESNFFNNVPIGPHTITVIDLNGCNSTEKEIVIIDLPQFMTPNNDGYFDTWHITGVSQLEGTIVYIYNRYGKLLKTLGHNSMGWDGTYNGNEMPANDYWFVANIIQGDLEFQAKGHFALRR